jgi:hypothetical protein
MEECERCVLLEKALRRIVRIYLVPDEYYGTKAKEAEERIYQSIVENEEREAR